MKLKVFDRILLGILLIVAIIAAFVLFGMAANIITENMVTSFIALFYMFGENAMILAGCGLVILLISIKLLFAGKSKKADVRPVSALMKQNEFGGTFISLEALDTMVQKHCRAQQRIRDCHTTLQSSEEGVTIGIRLSVLPDTDVATLTSELQQSLKAYVEGLTGISVKEIGILIENATAPATAAVAKVD